MLTTKTSMLAGRAGDAHSPLVAYAHSADGVRIAYSAIGSGPPVVFMPVLPASHLEMEWHLPGRAEWYEDLARNFTVVRYDGRGSGLSEREVEDLSLEAHMSDLEAVVDSLGFTNFALIARHIAGPVALSYTESHSSRVSRLALWHTFSKVTDFTDSARNRALLSLMAGGWELFTEMMPYASLGASSAGEAKGFASYMRTAISSITYKRYIETFRDIDCTDCLSQIHAPVLVFHRRDAPKLEIRTSCDLAAALPNARFILVDGSSSALFGEDMERITETLLAFLHEDTTCLSSAMGPASDAGLTAREEQILRLVAQGRQNKAIAIELGVSVHTVDRHLANIYNKIGAHNRVEAASFALRRGLG